MKTTDWRELCRELVDAQDAHDATGRGMTEVLTRARAALSEPVGEPAPPAAGEAGELVRWLRGANWDSKRQTLATRAADLLERQAAPVLEPALARINDILNDSGRILQTDELEALELARQALEQRQTAPVPVSERPWEREGWCDGQGRCWWGRQETDDWFSDWTLATYESVQEFCTYNPMTVCLPATALPLPAGKGE